MAAHRATIIQLTDNSGSNLHSQHAVHQTARQNEP